MQIFLLMTALLSDNLEFRNTCIILGDRRIKTDSINNSVKISYNGEHSMSAIQMDGHSRIVNSTVFLSDYKPIPNLIVDYESKIGGMEYFVWKFIAFNFVVVICVVVFIRKMFSILDKKAILKDMVNKM